MCRFVYYQGPTIALADLVTRPTHSIIRQSYKAREREEPLNGDGFGLAWYVPQISGDPALFRSVTPAWNNQNLAHLARVSASHCILAHVRAATLGVVSHTNCHPFSWKQYAFMHNGSVRGFSHVRRRLLQHLSDEAFQLIKGTTDTEHAFALFVDFIRKSEETDETEAMVQALQSTVALLAEWTAEEPKPSTMNFAVSNGRVGVICRFTTGKPETANTLYVLSGERYICEDGVCRMEPNEEDAILVASEPLFQSESWRAVPVNHLVVAREDGSVEIRAV